MTRKLTPFGQILLGACTLLIVPSANRAAEQSWIFKPPRSPSIPQVSALAPIHNPIDAFINSRLEAKRLSLNHEADRLTLLRRVTMDLTGLAPTLAEQEALLRDTSPDAYEKVVERLLASPRYGERWAQHWLDLVRYAESDGFKADDPRPQAHQYRDYVIRALNRDLPYDRFVRQQIAGDELEAGNSDALVATGYLRLYPDEYNAANLEQRRQEILNDVTDVTGSVFLGLTVGCARCHDHKFDPTSQKDYYRLQSAFAAMFPRDDLYSASTAEQTAYQKKLAAWESDTAAIRAEIEKLIASKRKSLAAYTLERFRQQIQDAVKTPTEKRTPYQEQIAAMARKQLDQAADGAAAKMAKDKKKKYDELVKKLKKEFPPKPQKPRTAMAMLDVGKHAPPTHVLKGGDWRKTLDEVSLAFPPFLGKSRVDEALPRAMSSTGRRAALARWLTKRDHPLTARVIVNRLWQHHFGKGIIASTSDFGVVGEPATHPQLLDWLALQLVENNWSLKHVHRLMVTSVTYRQSSIVDLSVTEQARAMKVDPDNELLWHARRRRLEGEAVRDAILTLTGDLNHRAYGRSARPKLPPKISKYAWKPDAKVEDRNRRSIYVFAQRNMRFPLFDTFDLPDLHNSCSRRAQTTTAPQALYLLNGAFTLEQAKKWSEQLIAMHSSSTRALVEQAYRQAWSRTPGDEEIALAERFIEAQSKRYGNKSAREQAIIDFCHGLLNTNEFLYVD